MISLLLTSSKADLKGADCLAIFGKLLPQARLLLL